MPRASVTDALVCNQCQAALDVSGAPQTVTPDELDAAIAASPIPVLLDVGDPGYGPSRAAAPIVDRIAKSRAGMLLVLKVNNDDHPNVARRYHLDGLPSFLMFRSGFLDAAQEGLPPAPFFARWVDGFALAA
jgi:thioredoxin 2